MSTLNTNASRRVPSDLFTVRVWAERVDNAVEWRGKVQHLPSGEARYFREWGALVQFMLDVLTKLAWSPRAKELREPDKPSG